MAFDMEDDELQQQTHGTQPQGRSMKETAAYALIPLIAGLAGGLLNGNQGAMAGVSSGLGAVGKDIEKKDAAAASEAARQREFADYGRKLDMKLARDKELVTARQDVKPEGAVKTHEYEDAEGNTRLGVLKEGQVLDQTGKPVEVLKKKKPEKDNSERHLDRGIKERDTLQNQYDRDPEVKRNKQVLGSYEDAKTLIQEKTPASDLALVFSYMKALDPGSVVRDTEQETASALGGLQERAKAKLASLSGDGRLSDVQRADLFKQIEKLAKSAGDKQSRVDDQFKGLAQRRNVEVEDLRFISRPALGAAKPTSRTKGAAAPADPDDMTDDELDAELARLRGGK